MKNVIFIAPPAAGKGTISKYLVDHCGYIQISTGNILRKVAQEDTEIGIKVKQMMQEGALINDDIILPLFKEELKTVKDQLFILDGMPRNLEQGKYLTELFLELNVDNYVVINIDIDEETLKKRIIGRRVCSSCSTNYNVYFDGFKPKVENKCDNCGSDLITRVDDNEESFSSRYETYLKETYPLVNYYKEKGLLQSINANKSSEEIINDVIKIINEDKND